MKFVNPVNIIPTMLVSSNVIDEDLPHWGQGTTYSQGQRVIYERRIYEVLAETTTDKPPDGILKHPPSWLDVGATNRWRMFDEQIGTQSTAAKKIVIKLQPGQSISALALFNLIGVSAVVTLTDPTEGVVYERTETLVDAGVSNWYEYFFKPIDRFSDVVLRDMPAYPNATFTLTIDNVDDEAAVGHLAIGTETEIGVALYGTSVGIIDYSRKQTDEWGFTRVIERGFSKRSEFDIVVDTAQVGRVQRLLASIRAMPVVWIGEDTMEATILFGYYRDFNINISGPSVSDGTITVEGLT